MDIYVAGLNQTVFQVLDLNFEHYFEASSEPPPARGWFWTIIKRTHQKRRLQHAARISTVHHHLHLNTGGEHRHEG